jgi:glycosyltransferase involved in cell wall biosynthesis
MNVSIVIPALNEQQYIGECISHIQQLDYPASLVEIIVVDNGSTDDTISILKEYHVNFSIDKAANISKLRNIGAERTKGDLICFVDADCFVDRSWLKNAVETINKIKNIGITGSYYGIQEKPTWVEKTWYELKKDIVGEVNFISSGNMIIHRKIFNEVGGFDETVITGEDYELCQRVRKHGYIIYNDPQIKVTHMGNFKKLSDIIKKERWYGIGMFSTIKHGQISKPLLISFVTAILMLLVPTSLFVGFRIFIFITLMLLSIPILVSTYFIQNVKQKHLWLFIKSVPISICYISGRLLAVFDFIKLKIKPFS